MSLLRRGDRVWLKMSPISGIAGGDRMTNIGPSISVVVAGGKNQCLNRIRISQGESQAHQGSPGVTKNDCPIMVLAGQHGGPALRHLGDYGVLSHHRPQSHRHPHPGR